MSNIEKKSQDANFDYEKELASVKGIFTGYMSF